LRDFSTAGFVLTCGGAISRLRLRSIMRSGISPCFYAPSRNVALLPYEFFAAAAEFFIHDTALLLWHPPVDECFLDSFLECGTTHSFFDSFQSFPVWW
jgi:hypothetical protein